MKKLMFVAVVGALIAVPAMADLSISYEQLVVGPGQLTSPHPGAIVDNFSTGRPAWTYGGNWQIVTGPISGKAAPPWYGVPDPTKYLAVPKDNLPADPDVATVYFGGPKYDYLGLFWGSMDSYNAIRLYDGATLVGTVTGNDATRGLLALGNQGNYLDNAYVNIRSTLDFDRIEFVSFDTPEGVSPYAFEVDNLAVAPVPGAALLGFLGLSAAGIKLRKYA